MKVMTILLAILLVILTSGIHTANAQDRTANELSAKMLQELRKEQRLLQIERKRLERYEQNLKRFETELDRRHEDLLRRDRELKAKERTFEDKVNKKTITRQVMETYEHMDPEQAALLIRGLFLKDSNLAIMLMRKMTGRKAGRIMEALVTLDPTISAKLAKETLNYYKPR